MLKIGKPGDRLERGLYVMPAMGESFEIILFAVRSDGRILGGVHGLVSVAPGANSVKIAEDLAERLDLVDPDRRRILRVV